DVFQFTLEDELAFLNFLLDPVEAFQDRPGFVLADNTFAAQHAHMRPAAGEVLARQPLVEINGGGNLPHDFRGTGFEPAAPHLVAAHSGASIMTKLTIALLGLVCGLAVLYGVGAIPVHAGPAMPKPLTAEK